MGKRRAAGGAGRDIDQPARHGFGRSMGIAREDQLVELRGLLRDGGGDTGMAMAVRYHPPAGNAVDQRAAVRQMQNRTLGAFDARDRLVQAVLGEGMPDRGSHGPALSRRALRASADMVEPAGAKTMEYTDICFAPVLSMTDAPDHPHNVARGMFVTVDGVRQPAFLGDAERHTLGTSTDP